jgi:hypothetical protein
MAQESTVYEEAVSGEATSVHSEATQLADSLYQEMTDMGQGIPHPAGQLAHIPEVENGEDRFHSGVGTNYVALAPEADSLGTAAQEQQVNNENALQPDSTMSETVAKNADIVPDCPVQRSTCRIRVRQDMFQDNKETERTVPGSSSSAPHEGKVEGEDSTFVQTTKSQEQDNRSKLPDVEKIDSHITARDEDAMAAEARSPPPRSLSRRLDYRRQRRHQWRSPVEAAVASPREGRSRSSLLPSPLKPKSKGPELITLNLNTESLDPEPPPPPSSLLLSALSPGPADWQLTIQPAEMAALSKEGYHLVQRLKLRGGPAELVVSPSLPLENSFGYTSHSWSASRLQGDNLPHTGPIEPKGRLTMKINMRQDLYSNSGEHNQVW